MSHSNAKIELVAAAQEQAPLLARLLELYAADFSEFHPVKMGTDGRFVYDKLPLYWIEAGRHPFLVMVEGEAAGFVFVKRGSEISGDPDVWDMAEFFVAREARRRGIGAAVARQVWRQLPGRWEVRVMEANQPAHRFWKRAIAEFKGEAILSTLITKNHLVWHLFSFES